MQGKTKCRTHGGASTGPKTQAGKDAIRRAHYKHGEQTLEAKAARSAKDAEMQALEDIMHVMNMTSAKRTRGRKAIGYVPIKTFEEARRWIYLDMLKKHEAENSAKT
jgi:C-terminal processing protease CtpA/Prc